MKKLNELFRPINLIPNEGDREWINILFKNKLREDNYWLGKVIFMKSHFLCWPQDRKCGKKTLKFFKLTPMSGDTWYTGQVSFKEIKKNWYMRCKKRGEREAGSKDTMGWSDEEEEKEESSQRNEGREDKLDERGTDWHRDGGQKSGQTRRFWGG